MSYETLLVEKDGPVDWLTLNRPDALNSLSLRMVGELHDYFDGLQDNYDVRVVVIRGAGRMFCAGLDMKDHGRQPATGTDEGMIGQRNFSGLVMKMRRAPQPRLRPLPAASRAAAAATACATLRRSQ